MGVIRHPDYNIMLSFLNRECLVKEIDERQSISFFEASFHFCARKLDTFIMNEKNLLPDRTARATRRTPPCRPTRAPRRSPGWQSGCYKERRGAKSWPRKRPRQRSARHRGLPLQAGKEAIRPKKRSSGCSSQTHWQPS